VPEQETIVAGLPDETKGFTWRKDQCARCGKVPRPGRFPPRWPGSCKAPLHEPKNLEQHNMILHPDEQKSLDVIDSTLGAGEPHLAGMFSIFTRLTAEDGIPPDEDRITVF
jgi:hypothetical protein